MNAIIVSVLGVIFLSLGYFFYATFIEQKVWKIDFSKQTPAVLKEDGLDYVPAKHWTILFGHHFASIAGAGPILGPVIACALFGWGPALLWIIVGSIFIGGVHDFSALMLSLRHHGATVGQVTEKVISRRSHLVFSAFLWLALVLVIAVFAAVTAKTLTSEPSIVIPTFSLILIAILFGLAVYRWKVPQWLATLIALGLAVFTIFLGIKYPINLNFAQALNFWIVILLIYSFLASITPVNLLLQPRDYLSSYFLIFGLLLGYLGVIVSHPPMHAPIFVNFLTREGPLWPMMFVLIACGAISGFHSLIASGTTSKQLKHKPDAKKVAFGAMILEGVLALLATITVSAGLYWDSGPSDLIYPILVKEGGWIVAFAKGFGQIVSPLIDATAGMFLAMLTLNSFVLTTLDTATRIGRYLTEEIFGEALGISWLKNKYLSTTLIILAALWLALGSWTAIWPVFGASNQLIAALVLLVSSVYLLQKRQPTAYTLYPALFMMITTMGALAYEMYLFAQSNNYLLFAIALVLLLLSASMLGEAWGLVRKTAKPR